MFDETFFPGLGSMMIEELAEWWQQEDLMQESVCLRYIRIKGVLTVLCLNRVTVGTFMVSSLGRKTALLCRECLLQEHLKPVIAKSDNAMYFNVVLS